MDGVCNQEIIKYKYDVRIRRAWTNMRGRCLNLKHPRWNYYGARGVTICDEWLEDYRVFEEWAFANGYRDDLTLDRYPEKNGNYEPSNCRWATWEQQANNRNRRKSDLDDIPPDQRHSISIEALGIERGRIMRGRKPKLNWTPCHKQFTVTIDGKLHRLGADQAEAERQFRFLLTKAEMAEPVKSSPTFGEVADAWLEHVRLTQDPERFRLCKGRVNEFIAYLGRDIRVKDLRPRHVEEWIASKAGLKSPGSKRLYKAMILAALNWAASAKVRLLASNPLRGKLELPEGESRGGEAVWPPEVFRLVVENSHPRYCDFLKALAWTGARPSTVRKIEAKHYNPLLKVWDVEAIYRGRLSKKKYVKRIWLSPPMVKLVERLNEEWPEGPIFRTVNGGPFPVDSNYLIMFKLRQRLARRGTPLPEGITLYGLRHTFATRFIVEHPDKLEYLREMLGHRDLTMILRHYSHLIDQHHALHKVLKDFRPL